MSWFPNVRSLRVSRVLGGIGLFAGLISGAFAAEVQLLEAGAAPRQELRITPKVGTTEVFSITLDLLIEMDMGNMGSIPQDLPPLIMDLNATITSVDPNGDIHYDFELKEMRIGGKDVDPTLRAALEGEIGKMGGTKGSIVSDNRGIVKESTIVPPEGASPQQVANMEKGMSQASASLPIEAVGVGAKWKVLADVKDNGMNLQQTTTYTLDSRSGSTVVVKTEVVQTAEDYTKAMTPNLPAGTKADLTHLSSKGSGETVVDLTKLFPTSGNMHHILETNMAVVQNGALMSVGMKMDMKMDMARK